MTIQFDSGLSVRIPNDQLVVPNLTINPQTGQLVANGSDPELVIILFNRSMKMTFRNWAVSS